VFEEIARPAKEIVGTSARSERRHREVAAGPQRSRSETSAALAARP
jgi:hypothetical protein